MECSKCQVAVKYWLPAKGIKVPKAAIEKEQKPFICKCATLLDFHHNELILPHDRNLTCGNPPVKFNSISFAYPIQFEYIQICCCELVLYK